MGLYASQLVSDGLRLSYQGCEASFLDSDMRNGGQPPRLQTLLFATSKIGIAAIDFLSTAIHASLIDASSFFNTNDETKIALNIAEGGFRVFDLVRCAYLHLTDPDLQKNHLKLAMVLNALNIFRISANVLELSHQFTAYSNFFQKVATISHIADSILRVGMIFFERQAIKDRIIQMYQNFSLTQLQQKIGEVWRGCQMLTLAYYSVISANNFLEVTQHAKEIWFIAFMTRGFSFIFLSAYASLIPYLPPALIANHRQAFRSTLLGISTCTTLIFAAAAAVGLGVSKSLKDIVIKATPMAALVALTASIAYSIKSTLHYLGMATTFGIPVNHHQEWEWSMALMASIPLSAITAVGFGITESPSASFRLMIRTAMVVSGLLWAGVGYTLVDDLVVEHNIYDMEELGGITLMLMPFYWLSTARL